MEKLISTSIHENAPSSVIRLARIYQEAFKELLKEEWGSVCKRN